MPNRRTHSIAGGLAGMAQVVFSTFAKEKPFNVWEMGLGLGAGLLGGIIPDKIEPARHWNHRSHFHSIVMGSAILGLYAILCNPRISGTIQVGMKSFCLGYLSHLALDARTPVGLPIL